METPSMEEACPTKIKTEIVDEDPTIPVVPPSHTVNTDHIKKERPSDDEDQKPDSDCPPLKKRKPEYVEHDLSKEPDQTQQRKQNYGTSGCNDDYYSSATENKIDPNDSHILKGNNETKVENSECIQKCSPLTINAANQDAEENYTILPGICPNEDKLVQVKTEPEHLEENSHVQEKKINGKKRPEKIKWFKCNSEGCPYKTRYYVVFVRHQLSHKYRSRLKCRYCSFSCKSRGMLTSHLLEHIEAQNNSSTPPEADNLKEMNWLSCLVENCSFKTKNCASLEKHVTYHKRQQLLKCRYCSMTCRGRVCMKAHLLRHHRKENDDRKSCADGKPQSHSSDSDSESEVDIRAMILKDDISDVIREENEKTALTYEENSQRASQDYKGNDTNELAQGIDDTKEEVNDKESEVKRTITITIRHSKKSEDSSSLTTAVVSGILKSFDLSDGQTNSCQKHVADEDNEEHSYEDINRESQDIPGSEEFKKPTVVADILRLFDVSNEDKETGSSSVAHQRHIEVQETHTSAPNETRHSTESLGENMRDNQSEIDTFSTSTAGGKPGELAENNKCDLLPINKEPQPILCDSQSENGTVEVSATDGKPGELAENNKLLSVNEKPQPTLRDNQSENGTVKIATTDGKLGELAKNNKCELPSVYEKPLPTLCDIQSENSTSTTDGKPEELAKNIKCELLSINEKPQPTLHDNQSKNDAVNTSTNDGNTAELAKNNKCELKQSTITPNGVHSKSDKEKIANLKQVVIRRVRKILAKNSSPVEDRRTSNSSRIPKLCADSQCPYKTASAQDMKQHLAFHDNRGIFKCPSCSYGCQNVLDLKEHMNLHIEKCNSLRNNVEISPLTSLTSLQKPNEEDTGQDLEPLIICNPVFTCKFCPTKLNHEKLFKLHLIRHCSTTGIKCPLCTFKSSKTDLLKHLSCHVLNVDGMFLCPLCTEKKRNKESVDDHVKVIHSRALFQEHNATCSRTLCNGHC